MKQQISRLSPHQNGKVFAVMMALMALIIMVPFTLVFAVFVPASANKPPLLMLLLLPLLYLVVGYISTVIGSALYNLVCRFVGGFEFESKIMDRRD